jgi:hypothetical protein
VLWLGVRKIKRHLLVLRNFRAQANMSRVLLVIGSLLCPALLFGHILPSIVLAIEHAWPPLATKEL